MRSTKISNSVSALDYVYYVYYHITHNTQEENPYAQLNFGYFRGDKTKDGHVPRDQLVGGGASGHY